jgi:hypothetical protein
MDTPPWHQGELYNTPILTLSPSHHIPKHSAFARDIKFNILHPSFAFQYGNFDHDAADERSGSRQELQAPGLCVAGLCVPFVGAIPCPEADGEVRGGKQWHPGRVEGGGGPGDEEDHHEGRHSPQPGEQRVREEVRVRDRANLRVVVPAPRGREAAGDGRQVVRRLVRVRRRGARDHQRPPGDAGPRVGLLRREGHRADGVRAALHARADGAGVLRRRRAAVHVRLPRAHRERRVHRRAQLRALHRARGALERAPGHARVSVARRHRDVPPCARLPLSNHSTHP